MMMPDKLPTSERRAALGGIRMTLRELWALPLEEQVARRHYPPWGQLVDVERFPPLGRFRVVKRTDGKLALVDPALPWNAATVEVFDHGSDMAMQHLALLHPGDLDPHA